MNHAHRFNAPCDSTTCVGLKVLETRASGRAHVELVHMRRRRAFARLAVAWALAASASPAVHTDDGAPRARNATAAAPRSLGASFHVELADGRLSASVATLLPAARSVLVVDVEDVIRDFAKEGRYDVGAPRTPLDKRLAGTTSSTASAAARRRARSGGPARRRSSSATAPPCPSRSSPRTS